MILQAYAKINLTLDVLCKRPDGYHELKSLMQRISLYDRIYMEPLGQGVRVEADAALPEDNTARRAAAAYMARFGSGGARIGIEKRIPSEAGLGGGSADAAAVLLGMEALYGCAGAERNALFQLAEGIGADVPFCLHGGCALCEGIGERLSPLRALSLALLLVKPRQGVSTGALFRSLPLPVKHPDTAGAMAAIEAGDVPALGALVENALEPQAARLVPAIGEYKARLLSLGALGAAMTGSGSAVFGVFSDMEGAERAKIAFPDAAFAAVLSTV